MSGRHGPARALWYLYILLLIALVAVKFDGSLSALEARLFSGEAAYNLVPLRTLRLQWRYISSPWGRRNMLGNILPFMPLGFLSPGAFPSLAPPLRLFFFAFALILGIELFQLVTRLGSFDVDDILLNMLGTALGYALLRPGKQEAVH